MSFSFLKGNSSQIFIPTFYCKNPKYYPYYYLIWNITSWNEFILKIWGSKVDLFWLSAILLYFTSFDLIYLNESLNMLEFEI